MTRLRVVLSILAAGALAGCHGSATTGTKAATAAAPSSKATAAQPAPSAPAAGEAKAADKSDDSLAPMSVAELEAAMPGIDPKGLDAHERAVLAHVGGDVICDCGSKPTTLAGALKSKPVCALAKRMGKLASFAVKSGASSLNVSNVLEKYYASFAPKKRVLVPIDPKTCTGPKDAPITLVEFADFLCPHCREAFPRVHATVAAQKGKVRWCYLNFPLRQQSLMAAQAGEFAARHGKFFEMATQLFGHQDSLSRAKIISLAGQLGLDSGALDQAITDGAYLGQIKSQLEEARHLGLEGTPAFFINGRQGLLNFTLLPWMIQDEQIWMAHKDSWVEK